MMLERRLYKLCRPLISLFFLCFDGCRRPDKNLWVFPVGTLGAWRDNLRFVYDAAAAHAEIRCVILFAPGDLHLPTDAEAVPRLSLKGLALLWRCGVCFVHHGPLDHYYALSDPRRQVVNLWHGITLKNIGIADRSLDSDRLKRQILRSAQKYRWTVASSEDDAEALRQCYGLDGHAVKVTGLPRNDRLIQEESALPPDMAGALMSLRQKCSGRRLVAYVPTWRSEDPTGFQLSPAQQQRLIELLAREEAVLGIKAHPNAPGQTLGLKHGQFIDLSKTHSPEIGVLLHATDVLVTDYSSIWVDSLLLGRPIVGFCYDYDSYTETRGFVADYETVFPGPLNRDFDALLLDLEAVLHGGMGPARQRRQQAALARYHAHTDGGNTARVIQIVQNELDHGDDR